uniref:Trafficking protein particle complex subunit n=1 Tax=Spongospora subterranea TaxID=70186 RepID=A0A0H5QKB8_9EUKA|eukprot:CRZ02067.1 hypothetical protein [Spongospora subterranea]
MGRVAFKMFLGVTATVQDWAEDGSGFSFILPAKNNPLVEFVELPKEYADLTMCALVAGAVRGALEMIQVRVETSVIRDSLKGDDCTEIRVIRKGIIREEFNPGDD